MNSDLIVISVMGILKMASKYNPIQCKHCGMEFKKKDHLKRHIHMIHIMDEHLDCEEVHHEQDGCSIAKVWTQILKYEFFSDVDAQYFLILNLHVETTRSIKLDIMKYENGNPTEYGVSFGPEDHRFVSAILYGSQDNNEFTSVQFVEDYVKFKQNKKSLILPRKAFEALKNNRQIIMDILRYQRKNNPEVAELIIRLVIVFIFGDRPKAYKNLKYLEPARVIGKYFNISETKLLEVINFGYSRDNNILHSGELRHTIFIIAEYNNFKLIKM